MTTCCQRTRNHHHRRPQPRRHSPGPARRDCDQRSTMWLLPTRQTMQAAAGFKQTPRPNDQQIVEAMSDNICRCGIYQRIRAAIKSAAESV